MQCYIIIWEREHNALENKAEFEHNTYYYYNSIVIQIKVYGTTVPSPFWFRVFVLKSTKSTVNSFVINAQVKYIFASYSLFKTLFLQHATSLLTGLHFGTLLTVVCICFTFVYLCNNMPLLLTDKFISSGKHNLNKYGWDYVHDLWSLIQGYFRY